MARHRDIHQVLTQSNLIYRMPHMSDTTTTEQMPSFDELRERYPELGAFTERILTELWSNRDKGDQAGWRAWDLRTAWQEISWHSGKLTTAIKDENWQLVHELTADVAISALILDDLVNIIEQSQTPKS